MSHPHPDPLPSREREILNSISEAVRLRIQQLEKERLDTLLAERYQATRQESLDLAREFEQVDTEGWNEY